MNVLITSAGRRTSLLQAFTEAVRAIGGKTFVADMDGLAPTLYLADGCFRVPPVENAQYIDSLLQIVSKEQIKLIVPTIDPELLPLSENAERFSKLGCHVLISQPSFIHLCNDKWLTILFLRHHGFRTPRSWLPGGLRDGDIPEDLFVKPRDGSASQHAYRATSDKIQHYLAIVPNPIVQEYLRLPEFTIDALLSLEGEPIHYVIRERIKVIGGECVEGVTVAPEGLHEQVTRLLQILGREGARGPLTIQAFACGSDLIFSEINPRFGGGFPLSYAAGAKYPQWILDMLSGKQLGVALGEYVTGLFMTRYYQEIFVENALWE